jgi:hypothetical protein
VTTAWMRRSGGAVRSAWGAVRRAWDEGVHIQQVLLDAQRPWEREGPLQWQREIGGHRLVGSHLPPVPSAQRGCAGDEGAGRPSGAEPTA